MREALEFFYTTKDFGVHTFFPKFSQFPSGEHNVELTGLPEDVSHIHTVGAVMRGTNPDDMMKLALWRQLQLNTVRGFFRTVLVVPYLPASRSDKAPQLGAKVYGRIFKEMGFDEIVTFDPHSPEAVSAYGYTLNSLTMTEALLYKLNDLRLSYDGVIAPDAGARDRAGEVAGMLGVPLYQAGKKRDPNTGKLIEYTAPDGIENYGRYLVVDDICDGGGTFELLAAAVTGETKLDLFVTHGFFNKGLNELLKNYYNIFSTNTVREVQSALVIGLDIMPTLRKHLFTKV